MPALDADLLAEYLREPRRIRRGVSRDLAREHPIPPKRAQHGAVARWVNKRRPMPHRFDGIMVALGAKTPHSGQARINAKRKQRAEFWRTVKIRVSAALEPHFRDRLDGLGLNARILGRLELDFSFAVDLDVHIPGAPAGAMRAEPVYSAVIEDGRAIPRLNYIVWYDADDQRMEFPDTIFTSA